MPAGRYDLEVEQGAPYFTVFAWCVDDADQTPIAFGSRVPYVVVYRDGIPVYDSGHNGGIELTVEPDGAAGVVYMRIGGTDTAKILHPYLEAEPLRYRMSLLDPQDATNTVEFLQGLVSVALESS